MHDIITVGHTQKNTHTHIAYMYVCKLCMHICLDRGGAVATSQRSEGGARLIKVGNNWSPVYMSSQVTAGKNLLLRRQNRNKYTK